MGDSGSNSDYSRLPVGSVVSGCPDKKKHWIEIALVYPDGAPVPNEEYEIQLPNGSKIGGLPDSSGTAHVDGIDDPGTCQVTFPNLDANTWKRHSGKAG
jgi:hypothetical protein